MKHLLALFLMILSFGDWIDARDFNTRLIVKLSQMNEVTPPKKIVIKYLKEKEIIENYEKWLRGPCIENGYEKWGYCKTDPPISSTFLYGRWIPEKDPLFFHVELHKGSGMDTLIHEFFHWYLGNRNPEENNDHNAERMMIATIESNEFKKWLEEEE